MSTSKELRQQFASVYDTIIGRNDYDQNLRSYVFSKYSNGKYYSDCSSSGCATYNKIGLTTSLLNTAGMYNSSLFEKVNVQIVNGHILDSEFAKLRQADALMYVGNDPSRPLQIGHVEYIHTMGTKESDTKICGHGSGTPSYKNMKDYNTTRQASKATNGKAKGLICVLRRIKDDGSETKKEVPVGWNCDTDKNKWWYKLGDGTYPKNAWYKAYCNADKKYHWFLFDKDSWMLTGHQTFNGKEYYLCEAGDLLGACMISDKTGALSVLDAE